MTEFLLIVLWGMGSAAVIMAGAVLAFKAGIPAVLYAGMVLVAALEGFSVFIGIAAGAAHGWLTGVLVGISVGLIFFQLTNALVLGLMGTSIIEGLARSALRRPH